VQLSADGRWLVAKSKSQAANWLRVWDLWAQDVGQSPYILRGHDAGVTAFTLTSRIEGTGKEKGERSSWLVSAGFDGSVRAWDLTRLSSSAEPIALQSPARGPGFGIIETSPALRWLAISTATGATELWNLEKPPLAKKPPIVLPAGKERFPTLLASRDKRWLLALASDNKGHVWDLMSIDAKNAARPHCVLDLDGAVADFFVSNDATWISAAVRKGNSLAVQLWKLKTAADQAPSARTAEPAPLSIAALRRVWGFVELEKGVGLLTETPSKMSYWNLSEDKIAEESMPFLSVNHVPDITLSPNGRTILAAPAPASKSDIYAIKLDGSGAPFKPRGPFRNFELLYKWDGLALNNSRLVAWENGKRFMAWSLDDPTQMPVVADTKGAQIDSLSFDFRWAVARMGQSKRELWDLQSNSPFQGVPLEEGIGSCIFSVDSKWLITAGNQFLKVRQLTGSKREPVAEFAIPREGENNQALIEPQGFDMRWATVTGIKERVLLALGQDLTIRVWDSAVGAAQTPTTLFRGQLIVDPMGGNGHAFVVPDGKRLFLLDARRNVLQISRIDADDLIAKAERTVGRNLSPAEWKDLKIPQKYEKIFPNLKEIDADMGPSPLGKLKAPGKVTAKPLDDRPNLSRGEIILDAAGELTGAEPIRPYAIRLETERWYQFDMTSTQVDSLLTLEDPDGKLVIQDDDGGGYPDARIIFKCPKEGTYKIVASGFAGGLGKYSLVVRASEHFQAPQRPITDLILSDGKVTRTGSLTPDDVEDQTFRGCPSKIFSVKIDGGKICQIDLKSSDFVPGLRLEDAKGTPLAFGGDGSKLNARIVVPITTGADYRIVVISRSQASGGFELSIRTR
jgi:WD40 repeat protein